MASDSINRREVNLFVTLKKFLAPLIVIISVVLFFLSYNTYLVDHSLEDLKFVLEQTAKAQNIEETGRIGVLLDDLLISEVSSLKLDSLSMVNLEFTKNIVSKGGVKEQLSDVEFLLNKLVKKREKNRGSWLLAFDRMNNDLQKFIRFITKELPGGALRPEIFKTEAKIDLSLLETARAYESNWQLKEAISAYEEFINKYPSYTYLRLVKLQLADSYFKSTNYREAKRLYEMLIKEAPQSEEAKTANIILAKVEERLKKQTEKNKIQNGISKLTKAGSMDTDYKSLGVVDSYLDTIDKETQKLIVYVMEGTKTVYKPTISGIDLTILDKAKKLESTWQLKEAQDMYEGFISKYPTYAPASIKLILGGVYLKSMQYSKALEIYEGIIRDYPDSNEADLAKKLLLKTKDIVSISQKRQLLVEKIAKLKTAPELAQAYYNLGMVDIYLFDLANAKEAFKKVIALAPNTDLAKRAEFNLGWVYKFGAEYNNSVTTLAGFIVQNPKNKLTLDATYHLADSYYKWGKFEEAAMNYEEFANKFTDSPVAAVAQLQAGYTYLYNLHDPIKAAAAFKKLKDKYPETDFANYVSISLVPTTERSYRDYGFILLREGKFSEAKEAFKKAVEFNKEDAWAYCGLGTANVLLASIDEAIISSKTGVKKIADEYTHASLAFAYDEKGDYAKAIEEYIMSISKNPGYMVSHYNLGRDYAIMGWYDRAILEFKEAIKIIPNFAETHNNLGYAYWYKGRVVDAEFEFKTAISYKKNLAEAQYNLGLVYESYEKYGKAAICFKEALSINPDLEAAQMQLERVQKKIR
ncbi:MAG: tetratricopeptide repeat protein [Candidatus Omnitrophica bacterium]|nr:tetratricopeptide repeat protein [Candidatus Omnitrophota bacterium]